MIAGVLVVVVVLGLWKLAWLLFDASLVWTVGVGWVAAALLPFAIRLASICLSPVEQTAYRRQAGQRQA